MLDEEPAAPETADGKLLCSDFCCHRCLIQCPTDLGDVPINIAEKARLSLEAFKTPLLPTRLQGSSSMNPPPAKKGRTGRWQQDRERGSRVGLGRAESDDQHEDPTHGEEDGSESSSNLYPPRSFVLELDASYNGLCNYFATVGCPI